mgnify:FL=1|jgi:hypothetical protein
MRCWKWANEESEVRTNGMNLLEAHGGRDGPTGTKLNYPYKIIFYCWLIKNLHFSVPNCRDWKIPAASYQIKIISFFVYGQVQL